MSNSTFEELLNRKEDLHPDLQDYVFKHPGLGEVLQHPLVYEIPYIPLMNALINARYQQKLEAIEKARKDHNFGRVLAMYERPWRWQALSELSTEMNDSALAEEFAWVWTDSENVWQNQHIVDGLIQRVKFQRPKLMNDAEIEELENLPEKIKVYRGCFQHNIRGLSWTLNQERAEWFAKRFQRNNPLLVSGLIDKSNVLFYTNGRTEQEIVAVDRKSVKNIKKQGL